MEFHPQPLRHAAGVLGVPGGQAVHLRVPVKTEHRAAADVAMLLQKRGGGGAVHPAGHSNQYAFGILLHHELRSYEKNGYKQAISVNDSNAGKRLPRGSPERPVYADVSSAAGVCPR